MAFAKSPSSTSARAVRLALESFNLPCYATPHNPIRSRPKLKCMLASDVGQGALPVAHECTLAHLQC